MIQVLKEKLIRGIASQGVEYASLFDLPKLGAEPLPSGY